MSLSAMADSGGGAPETNAGEWPAMPVETEIYLLPDGRVVVADLPIELADLLAKLGAVEACSAHAQSAPVDTSVDTVDPTRG